MGDYASVSIAGLTATSLDEPRHWDTAMLPARAFNASTAPNVAPRGDFAPGELGAREYRSMTSFADIETDWEDTGPTLP